MSLRNANIMGEGTISGQAYEKVRVMGNANAVNDLEAAKLSVMGTFMTQKAVKAGKISIMGQADFSGISTQKMKIMGEVKCKGSADISYLNIMGAVSFDGNVKSDRIIIRGLIDARGDVEAERFFSKGAFHLGTLNANDIRIVLRFDGSSIEELGGETVKVHDLKNTGNLIDFIVSLFSKNKKRLLNAGTIEADRIYLENTNARSVRGSNVRIGPGCNIQQVEYKDSIWIDRNSAVENKIRI